MRFAFPPYIRHTDCPCSMRRAEKRSAFRCSPVWSDEPSVQEPQCRQWSPRTRQVGTTDRRYRVERRRLPRIAQERGIEAHLLLAPCLVGERGEAAGKDLGNTRGAPYRGDDRPERVVTGAAQADGLVHQQKVAAY